MYRSYLSFIIWVQALYGSRAFNVQLTKGTFRPIPLPPQENDSLSTSLSLSMSSSSASLSSSTKMREELQTTPLSMSIDELGTRINGRGRALTVWDCYKVGLDPLYFFNTESNDEVWDHAVYESIKKSAFDFQNDALDEGHISTSLSLDDNNTNIGGINRRDQIIDRYMPVKRRQIHSAEKGKGMGAKALHALSDLYPNGLGIEYSIASLEKIQRSSDGTVKLLLKLNGRRNSKDTAGNGHLEKSKQDYFIESVIIPWYDRSNPTSTLCVSTQVGCAQGCTFCATGKMGLLKRLSSDEILIQLYFANKICRILNRMSYDSKNIGDKNNGDEKVGTESNYREWLPDIDNIVFMGMGDSGDNADSVIEACSIMADRNCFSIPQNKITISTVGPNPEVFQTLGKADAVLAWSVHAVEDTLRKKLVPTTKYKMEELKEGLIQALMSRSRRMRSVMLEVTLIEDVNDGIKEAKEMVDFCLEMKERVKGMKLVVNLIPFNDIGHPSYQKSSASHVAEFQRILVENKINTFIRTTRGDDENAACGQLATKKLKGKQN